jgi:hypothetical protein
VSSLNESLAAAAFELKMFIIEQSPYMRESSKGSSSIGVARSALECMGQ